MSKSLDVLVECGIMNRAKLERTPLNVESAFYVEKDTCFICAAPEAEAPELIGYDEETGCYF